MEGERRAEDGRMIATLLIPLIACLLLSAAHDFNDPHQ